MTEPLINKPLLQDTLAADLAERLAYLSMTPQENVNNATIVSTLHLLLRAATADHPILPLARVSHFEPPVSGVPGPAVLHPEPPPRDRHGQEIPPPPSPWVGSPAQAETAHAPVPLKDEKAPLPKK